MSCRRRLPILAAAGLALGAAACGGGKAAAPTTTTRPLPPLPPQVVAYVTLIGTGSSLGLGDGVDEVDVTSGVAGAITGRVHVGAFPDAVAIVPGGTTAYVTSYSANSVTPIDVATGKAGKAIPAGDGPAGIAIAPDGKTAYVTDAGTSPIGDTVTPIDLVTGKALPPITVGDGPQGIAITPNGKLAFVADAGAIVTGQSGPYGDTVTPIDLVTGKALPPITVGNAPVAVAISPDGSTVEVANQNSGSVTPISVFSRTAGSPVPVDGAPQALAFGSGESSLVYAAVAPSAVAKGGDVTPISVANGTAGTPVKVCKDPSGLAVRGGTAWVTCLSSGAIEPVDLHARTTGAAVAVPGGPYAIALVSRPQGQAARSQGAHRTRPKR